MLLRGRGLGAALYTTTQATPGTLADGIRITTTPVGYGPAPSFVPGRLIVDYAPPSFPAPVPVTVATLVDAGMSAPMGPPMGDGGNTGGGSAGGGSSAGAGSSTAQALTRPDPTPAPATDATAITSNGVYGTMSTLSPDELAAIQAQNQALQAGNQQQQRKIWTMVLVGGAVVGGALLLTRRG